MKGIDQVRQRLERIPLPDILLSPVVLGELELGVEKSVYRENGLKRP